MSGQADVVLAAPPTSPFAPPPAGPLLERLLNQAGEWLNPILVKEARQALKSRVFVVIFSLVLVLIWGISIIGLALLGPEAAYGTYGPDFFFAYYLVLAFALLVIVPFGAFRSLAVEQEDRTYELLSITALRPWQIISGKLGSAVVQMIVYLSAVSPCLAFTYMLRGIDIPTILMVLFYTVLASLGLSLIGLLLGTLTHQKHLQVILSVLVTVGLLGAMGGAWGLAYAFTFEERMPFHQSEFWIFNGILVTFYATYFALVFFAAVAQITFATDNRSSRLRIVMVVQHMLLAGWMGWGWFLPDINQGVLIFPMLFAVLVGVHWFLMGAFMVGESPELSLRVKRNLPQSFLGRAFLTWFNPGPGTGYLFAVGGAMGGLALMAMAVLSPRFQLMRSSGPWASANNWGASILCFGVVGVAYLIIYLGVELLLVRMLRKLFRVDLFLGPLLQLLLILLGCATPLVIQEFSTSFRSSGYSLLQITNFGWTLAQFLDGPRGTLPPETDVILVVVPLAALVVFLANLPAILHEVRQVRIAAPLRVVEEDVEIAARVNPPPPPTPESPWD